MRLKLFQILISLILCSCNHKKGRTGTDAVYADYSITGEEGTDSVTCLLKFYKNRRVGSTLFLEPPAAVLFDGVAVPGDSAGLSGIYYEVQKPLDAFNGTHTIVFKNADGDTYKETFSFQPFSLRHELGEAVPRGDITIQLAGLQEAKPIRLLLTDTSFASPNINDIDTVKDGKLVITRNALRNVVNGPVILYLFKEEERPLKNPPVNGGKLSITYGLSREFELVE